MLSRTAQPAEPSEAGSDRGAAATPGTPRRTVDASGVRKLQTSDIPQLCDIFAQTFRAGRGVDRSELANAFAQLYMTSPLDRIQPGSIVEVGPSGRIGGFMGIITVSAQLGDRPLRAGVLGNFMAADHDDRTHAAMRLLRGVVLQDLDLIVSDTANTTSLGISRAIKFEYLPAHSLEWVKVLRPAGTAQFMFERHWPRLGPIVAPLARLADLAGRRLPFTALPDFDAGRFCDQAIEPAAFLERAPALMQRFQLRPRWDGPEFEWLLDQARRKTRNGPLHLREVADRNGRTVGLYLLYAKPGAVACALQVLARRGQDHVVLAALIRRAGAIGAVAVRGNTSPTIVEGLSLHTGVMFHQVAACVAYSRNPEIKAAIQAGDVTLGGLFGETWTPFVAAEFTPPSGPAPALPQPPAGRDASSGEGAPALRDVAHLPVRPRSNQSARRH